jgi:hypothetical protein
MLPNERDWCHAELALELPEPLAALAAAAGLRDEKLTYAALVLTNEPGNELERGGRAGALRLVSALMPSKGKVEAIGCTPEGTLVRLMRLDRHASAANADLDRARRGDSLELPREDLEAARVRVGLDATVRVVPSDARGPDVGSRALAGETPRR